MANLNRVVYLSEEQKNTLFANNTITVNGTTVNYNENDLYVVPDSDDLEGVNLKITGAANQLLTVTSVRASYAGASGTTPRYIPGKWRVNTGRDPQNGDMYVIQFPEASTAGGIYLSVNGTADADYHPLILNTTAMMTTHFAAGTTVMLVYEASSIGSVYALEPTTNDKENVTGIFRVVNFYDANTNTLLRTYASSSANEIPLTGTATSTSMAVPTHTSSYKDSYGGIPATVANRPVMKLSTGEVKIPSGLYLGTASSKLGKMTLYNTSNSYTTVIQSGSASANRTLTLPNQTGTVAITADIPSAYTSNPAANGTASAGSSTSWSKGDHVHPTDTTRAAATAVPTQASINSSGLITYKNSSNTSLFTLQLPLYDGSVTVDSQLISFVIGNTTYQAEEGMTWEEWVNSEYNIDDYIKSSYTGTGSGNTYYLIRPTKSGQTNYYVNLQSLGTYPVAWTDEITNNYAYYIVREPLF